MQFAQDRVQWEASVSHEVAYKWQSAGQGLAFKGICCKGDRQKCFNFMGPEALTAGSKMTVVWNVMLCPRAIFF